MPFDYNALSRAARTPGPDGLRIFPAFEDNGSDLACVLRDLRRLWEQGSADAAVAAAALLDLARQLRYAEERYDALRDEVGA
jgi:hypothetical protein